MERSFIRDPQTLISQARNLYYTNQLEKSRRVIERVKIIASTNDIYTLSGNIYSELGNSKQAEQDFKIAVFMVPNRMRSRMNLVNFYKKNNDTANATYWCNSIVNMPVKIISPQAKLIQKEAKKIISNYQ